MNKYQYAEEVGYTPTEDGKIISPRGRVLADRYMGVYLGFTVILPGNKRENLYVHRYIYWVKTHDTRLFDPSYHVHHIDGNPLNNRPDNLMLVEGRKHMSHHNTMNTRGAKITLEQAREIRKRYAQGGISQRALGAEYGITQTAVWEIIHGRKWGDKWNEKSV